MRCKICEKEFSPDESCFYYNNGVGVNCCSAQCFTSFLLSEKEKEKRDLLYDNLKRIFQISEVLPKMWVEVARTKKELHLTTSQLTATLHYMYDIKGLKVYSPTLWYVKDYVNEAREYYQKLKEKDQQASILIEKQKKQILQKVIKPNYTQRKKSRLAVSFDEV